MQASNQRCSLWSISLVALALTLVTASCGTADQTETSPETETSQGSTSTEGAQDSENPATTLGADDLLDSETTGGLETSRSPGTTEKMEASQQGSNDNGSRIEAADGSISFTDGDLTSTAVFDDAGFQHLKNDLGAWYNKTENVNTDIGDLDWNSEFVLMAVFDACDPAEAALLIAVDETRLDWVQGPSDCESLSPHVALFSVPLEVKAVDGTVVFATEGMPPIEGVAPIDVISPARLGGIMPAGVYVQGDQQPGDRPVDGVYFFDGNGREMAELLSSVVGLEQSGDPNTPGLQAQTDSIDSDEELLIVVVQSACAPSDFELVASTKGFTNTMWREPVQCVWAPQHAIVYVAPRESPGGGVYSVDSPPEITFETIEES